MDGNLVANYLTSLKEKNGFTYEDIAENSGRSLSTVKNLFSGKTIDPRLDTVAPVTYAAGGSIDEMLNGKSNEKIQGVSAIYEQYIKDLKEQYENRLADKDEIIKEHGKHGNFFKIFACVGLAILVGLLIIEVMHPDLGWIRF